MKPNQIRVPFERFQHGTITLAPTLIVEAIEKKLRLPAPLPPVGKRPKTLDPRVRRPLPLERFRIGHWLRMSELAAQFFKGVLLRVFPNSKL
ncbi:MAG: hypothetical protein DME97_10345 [Verrucomicrobia bacterium]|nr:MAG: hypothetical protein DME97_10345 [Verrucomicrobiota bacterium]